MEEAALEVLDPERELSTEELRALGIQYYGLYTLSTLDFTQYGALGDFMSMTLSSRYPWYVKECNPEQLKIIQEVSPELRAKRYSRAG